MQRQNTDIRQEQIKQAVLHIIYNEGLKNLSTKNLAKQIGLSEGAIFRHFPTKQHIILAIINDVQSDFIGPLHAIANASTPPLIRLGKFICSTINYLTENKGITMLMFSEASHNNDQVLKDKLLTIFNSQKNLMSKILLDGMVLGLWSKDTAVEDIAMLYMGIPISVNIELILNGGEFRNEEFCKKMIHLINKLIAK